MTNQFPDATKMVPVPSLELVQQWEDKYDGHMPEWVLRHVAAEAARWGAEQELHACCAWLDRKGDTAHLITPLLYARCPKPPSLKEQALKDLDDLEVNLKDFGMGFVPITNLRKALEALPNG
jgi:hypothetical protein